MHAARRTRRTASEHAVYDYVYEISRDRMSDRTRPDRTGHRLPHWTALDRNGPRSTAPDRALPELVMYSSSFLLLRSTRTVYLSRAGAPGGKVTANTQLTPHNAARAGASRARGRLRSERTARLLISRSFSEAQSHCVKFSPSIKYRGHRMAKNPNPHRVQLIASKECKETRRE